MFIAENEYFNNNKMQVLEYQDNGDLEQMKLIDLNIGLPSSNYPSDHLSIAYKVYFEF